MLAFDSKNLVFTGSYAVETQQNQYFPYDSVALDNITLHASNYNSDAVVSKNQGVVEGDWTGG